MYEIKTSIRFVIVLETENVVFRPYNQCTKITINNFLQISLIREEHLLERIQFSTVNLMSDTFSN